MSLRDSLPARQLRSRPLACFALAALLGAITAMHGDIPLAAALDMGGAALVMLIIWFRRRPRRLLLMLLLGFALGMGRMTAAVNACPPVETRYSVEMIGTVASDPFIKPDTGRLIARFLPETVDGAPSRLRLRLYLRGDAEAMSAVQRGQRLRVTGHIWANDPITNPHQFDFGAYLRRNDMDAIATAKIEDVTILETQLTPGYYLARARRAIGARIDGLFPLSAPIVRALVLGDRSLISEELRESLNATGTAHLIAISGLHVSVLAMLLTLGLRRFTSRRRAALIVLPPLMVYGALIGFTPSFVRALTMFAVLGVAHAAGLPSDPVTRLAAALLGFVLFKPLAIADGGFVLSFSATAGIILLMPPLSALFRLDRLSAPGFNGAPGRRALRGTARYILELLCASLAAQLGTLPAVVACFGAQSVVSLPFNLVCVPLCMLGYLLSLAALIVWPLAAPLAFMADALLSALARVARLSAALPVTTVRVGRYAPPLILLHCALMVAASGLCRLSPDRRRALPLALLPVAGLASLAVWLNCLPFRVTFLDVGAADCAIVQTEGRVYAVDVGDTYTPVADYLSATALGVDGVFLSHPHQDHAGGLMDLLDAFRPGTIYVPEGWFEREGLSPAVTEGMDRAAEMGIPIVELSAGDALPLSGDATLTVYNPDGPTAEINDMSLLMLVEARGKRVLFTGDLTMEGEPETIPDCDVLKVAHHGSDNATSADFLIQATPELAVISVGENSNGHPGDWTLERLVDSGATILRTDERGAITLAPEGEGWRVTTYLEDPDELE